MIGRTLGNYRIVEQIGQGGMATVFKAYDAGTDRYVALKVLPEVYARDPQYLERFRREAKAIANLEHFHILPVYAFGEDEGITYLVMRYLPTGTLAERLKLGPMPLREIEPVLGQVAGALDYAHRNGILHRDVKPSNVLLDADSNAYLTDFGIAKMVESAADLTATGGVLGTPSYMSPEQCMGPSSALTPATDVYSLGVVLYEMVTGRVPYQAETPMAVIRMKIMNEPLPPPRSLRPELPEAAERVVLRALAHEPEHRFSTCAALAAAFAQAIAGETQASAEKTLPISQDVTLPDMPGYEDTLPESAVGIPVRQTTQPPPHQTAQAPSRQAAARPPRKRRRGIPAWVWIAGGLVALAIVAGGVALAALLARGALSPAGPVTEAPAVAVDGAVPTDPVEETMPADPAQAVGPRVAVVLDTGGENDRSFNEYTLKGAREAAQELGLDFAYVVSEAATDYERNIENFISEGYNLVITVGFLMGDATAAMAVAHPDVHFAIIDSDFGPSNCPGELAEGADCYEEVLPNVTSLMFAEDETGYLAGVLAGCMTETNVIGSVSGMEIPPVVKFVTGYQNGARSVNPDVQTLNVYIPDFNDPATGKQAGQEQIASGADVIFGVGGNTGNGGLLAAHENGLMAIGVDVDQYFTYPEIAASLVTSAVKNMDVATADAVRAFVEGNLQAGIQLATVANDGVGLAPYHDWDAQIPQECKDAVEEARQGLANGTVDTGY